MLGSSLQPPAPVPGPTPSAAAPASPASSSCHSASPSAAAAASVPSPAGSPYHHHPSPHPHHPHPHHHPSPHHFGGGAHRTTGGLRVPWPPPASNHPPEGFGRFGGGLYSLFPAPAATVSNSPAAETVYSPSPSPSSPAVSPAATSFASADHYHSFIAAQKESLFSSTFSFNGGAGSLVGAGLQAHFSTPHVGLLTPATGLERGITQLEMMAKKGFGVDKLPISESNSTIDAANKTAISREAKDHHQRQQRRSGASSQHWPEARFIMPKSENVNQGQQQHQLQLNQQLVHHPCHDTISSPADLHNNNNRRRGSKRRWPEPADVQETNAAKMEARSSCSCHRPPATSSSTSSATTILTVPTSLPISQVYQPRGATVGITYHTASKGDPACRRNGMDSVTTVDSKTAGMRMEEVRKTAVGSTETEEEQRNAAGGCSRTTPVALRCPRESSTPTHGTRSASSTPHSPLPLHHIQQQQAQNLVPPQAEWNGGGLLQLQVTVKKESGTDAAESAGTTPCQVAEVTTSRNSAEGVTPTSNSNGAQSTDTNPIAALSQMPLLCMSPNAVLLKSIKVEEGPMPPSPGVVSPTTTSTTPVECAQSQNKDCNGRQTPVKKQHSKSKKDSMTPYAEVPLSSTSSSVAQVTLGPVVGRQRTEDATLRLAPLPHVTPVSLPQLEKRPEGQQATSTGGLLLVRGGDHQKGRVKGVTDLSQTPSTPTLTVSAPSAMVAPVPACNPPSAEQLTATSISASAIAASGAVLQPAPCEEAAAGEVAAAVAAAVANGMHSWAGPAPLHHSPALTPPHHLHHHHTLWLGQGQTFPAPVPLQLSASQAQGADTQHVPLPPVGYQLVRDPLTGQLLLIPATNLAEHLQRAAAAAAAAVVWPSFPSALPPHASATSPHLHQLMLQQTQQPQQQHIQLFPGSQHPQQPQHQSAEHHQTDTEYRILFQHQIQQQHQQQHHQSHQLQQQPSQEQTLVIPPVHDFVKKKDDGEVAPLVGGHASTGILIAVPKVEVVEPEEESTAPISVDDVKPGMAVTTAPAAGFLHPHQQHVTHSRRATTELLVPSVATIGTVVSPAAAQAPSAVATSTSYPPYVFPASLASAVGATATPVATATAVTSTPAVQYFYEHTGVVRMAQAVQPSAAVQTESGRRSQGTSPVNPADTCLTPPPEAPCVSSEVPEETNVPPLRGTNTGDNTTANSEMKPSSSSSTGDPPTEHEPRTNSTEMEQSSSQTTSCTGAQEIEEPMVQVQDAGNQTEMTMGSDDDSGAINASSDEATSESTQHASAFTTADVMTSDSQDVTSISKPPRLIVIQPPLQSPHSNLVEDSCDDISKSKLETKQCVSADDTVDVSGLELLSNSIEQFENNRTKEMPLLERHEANVSEKCDLPEIDEKVKKQDSKTEDSEIAPCLDVEPAPVESAKEQPKSELEEESIKEHNSEEESSGALAGGLGLLCALAEQRFMEEVARSEPANQTTTRPVDSKVSASQPCKSSVDIHRNYKSPKSEREIKAFIASKVSQYQGQNNSQLQPFQYSQVQQNLFQSILNSNSSNSGIKGFPSSPFSSTVNGGSTSTGSSGSCSGSFGGTSDVMDAMELDMRMRLAELQRKYREKQRELSRLQHSRTKATGDEATTASGAESCAVASSDNPSPTKRGPGRPRKQAGKKTATPLNSSLASSRRGSSSSSGSSCCGGTSPQKELSPPVLEKVTEVMALRKRRRKRQRKTLRRHHKQKCGYSEDEDDEDDTGDEEEGSGDKEPAEAAPRLRVASKDILKPPTLTANRIINCARFKPEETSDGLSSEASIKAFKLPQCNVNLVKLKASTISGRVKASELTPALSKPGSSNDVKVKTGLEGAATDKLPNGPSLLVSASSASGASWLARNTQNNNNSYITSSNTSDHNKNKASNISNNDNSSLSPFQKNSILNPSPPSPLNGKALLAPSSLRIPSSVPSVRKQSLSCYTFGSKQLTPSLLSSGEKQRLESLTSDSSLLWFLKPDTDASKEPAVGVGGFSPSQKAEEKRTPPTTVTNDSTSTTTTTTTTTETNLEDSLISGRKRKTIPGIPQADRSSPQRSPLQSLRSSPSSLSSSSSSSSIYSSSSSSPAFKKRKPGRPKKHSTRYKTQATETIVAKKLKKKTVVGFMVGPPAPTDPPTDSRAPLAPPTPSAVSAPASPATASTAPLTPCPSPHKPKIKPKLKAEAKVKSSLSCDDEDDWIQLPPSIPSPMKGRRRVFDDTSSPSLPTASSAGSTSTTNRIAWNVEGGPPSLGWSANSSVTAVTPNEGFMAESPPKITPTTTPSQQTVPRGKKKPVVKGKLPLAKKKAQNQTSSANTSATTQAVGASEPQTAGIPDTETAPAPEKRRRSGERAATTQDLLRSLKKRQTRTQSAGGTINATGAGNSSLSGAATAAKVTVRSRSFADNHESSSYSEGENVPLIALKERPLTPAPRSCKITQEDLHDGLRALTSPDGGGLLYAGQINAIQAPDVYGITLDGERGHRPHIYSREEILKDAIAEVRPGSIRHLQPGTRICAYWSQQYRCLYPGTVASPSSPDPELDRRFVGVEFDDGDSGRININDIRLLPQDFPIVDYDPNPLMSLARRRRRASGASASGTVGDGVISKDKKDQPLASGTTPSVSSTPAAADEASTSAALLTCDSSLNTSKAKKRKKDTDGESTTEQEIRKKASYWKEMEKTSTSTASTSASGSAMVEADSSGLPMPNAKTLNVTKKLTAAEKERRRMRKREKARKRDKMRRQQLLAAKIAATSMTCDELSTSPGSTANAINPLNSDITSLLKKKHKKHRSNKCDEKCLLLGKKHRHHHHHRKHHRHHHHKHRHHRRGSRHCIGSSVLSLTNAEGVTCEPIPESLTATTKATISSPAVLTHTKRKKKKKKTESKIKEPTPNPTESSSVPENTQTSISDSNEAPALPSLSSEIAETLPPQPTAEVVEENDTTKEDNSAAATKETVETTPKKTTQKNSKKENSAGVTATKASAAIPARKQRDRQPSVESRSKMAAFLPARQLWRWSGRGFKRPGAKGRGKKEFYKSIQRGKETIKVGDCAVFLSTGRPDRPYIGSIESMWESWGGNMVVRVKWFYHPEETKGGPSLEALKFPGALFQSPHIDENDVQTISHKCEVLAFGDYRKRMGDGGTGDEMEPSRYASVYDNNDVYYLAGHYDPTNAVLTMEPDVTKG